MPYWDGFFGIFPLVGLVIMVVMVFACLRMMGGISRFGCMGGHDGQSASETDNLRREVRELKQEIRKLHDRS
jgi:cell division protein FtsB